MAGSVASSKKYLPCTRQYWTAARCASARSWPSSIIVADSAAIFRRLTGLGFLGRNIVAGTPNRLAAKAAAAPWFPVLAATTSVMRSAFNFFHNAYRLPRILNDPVGNADSSLRKTCLFECDNVDDRTSGVG